MNIQPIKGKLIVEVVKVEETKSTGGIILGAEMGRQEEENPHDTLRAVVIEGHSLCFGIKKGDVVYFEQRHSAPVFNNDYKVILAKDLLGKEKQEVFNEEGR